MIQNTNIIGFVDNDDDDSPTFPDFPVVNVNSRGNVYVPIDSAVMIPTETLLMVRSYCGNVVYKNGRIERVLNDYGYCDSAGMHYYIKDYQGNVRAIINDQGTLEEVNNYYPFGALTGSATVGVQPLKLESKELDRENGLDLYDFQTRQQDPASTLFTTQDPLCEQDFGTSPYAYCAGNPVRYIDPTGMIIRSSFDGVDYDYRLGDDGRYDFFEQQGNPYMGQYS